MSPIKPLLLPLICLVPLSALAESGLTLNAGFTRMTLKEHDGSGALLVRESGVLPRVGLEWSRDGEDWFTGLTGDLAAGDIDYDGQTQAGVPHRTTGRHVQGQLGGLVGRTLAGGSRIALLLRGAGDDRALDARGGVAGVHELYQQVWTGVQGEYPLWRQPGNEIRARAAWLYPLWNRQQVFPQTGEDDFELEAGSATSWEASLTYTRTQGARVLTAALQCRDSHLGVSNRVLNTINGAFNGFTSHQPDIRFRDCGLSLGWGHAWR